MAYPLDKDWFTRGVYDAEHKQWVLLAYLKTVQSTLGRKQLYPDFNDLKTHYKNLTSYQRRKSMMRRSMPKRLESVDWSNLTLNYTSVYSDHMDLCDEVIDFALPRIKDTLTQANEMYEVVNAGFEMESIGVTPLYIDEGYFLLRTAEEKHTNVYRYQLPSIQSSKKTRLHIWFLDRKKITVSHTYNAIKSELTTLFSDLPNPAVFALTSKHVFPYYHTILPAAIRYFTDHLWQQKTPT